MGYSHGLKCILGQITSQTLYGRQEYSVLSEASTLVFEKNFTQIEVEPTRTVKRCTC